MTLDIDSFDGKDRFLSNFYPAPVTYEGLRFPTVEHAFQAAKTTDVILRQVIARLPTPGLAKKHGRVLMLRAGWDNMRLDVMRMLLAQKFSDPTLRARLVATAPAKLVEGNTWGDRFWGVCQGIGENHLGRLLMEIRDGKVTP